MTMTEYRQPVARSKAVRVPASGDGRVSCGARSTAGRARATGRRAQQAVISASCLSSCSATAPSVWSTAACHAERGEQPDRLLISLGDRPAAGEQHGAAPPGQRQQVRDQLVGWRQARRRAPAAGERDARGDLADRRAQHRGVIGEGSDQAFPAGAASPRLSAVFVRQPHQWMEAVPLLEHGEQRLLLAVRGDQRSVQVDDQPGQQLPGDGQPREPGRGHRDQRPDVRADRPGPGQSCPSAPDQPLQASAAPWYPTDASRTSSCTWPFVNAGRPERDRRAWSQRQSPVHQRELPHQRQHDPSAAVSPPDRPAYAAAPPRPTGTARPERRPSAVVPRRIADREERLRPLEVCQSVVVS